MQSTNLLTILTTQAGRWRWTTLLGWLCLALWSNTACTAQVRVAVASNFAAALKAVTLDFERDSGHKVLLSPGATGKLYAQIKGGAPFDLFLAADDITPARLAAEGLAVAGSRFTYAVGKLVLWSPQPGLVDAQARVLQTGRFKHLAIASPKLAPYGFAAEQVLARMGLLKSLGPRLVQGESIGQTYGFVASGNAELGFVALSQLMESGRLGRGSSWLVPSDLYPALRQDAVLLTGARDKVAAQALLSYLKTPASKTLLRSFGYDTE